jgi:hypothetical protein
MSRTVERRVLGYDRPMRRAGYQLLGFVVWKLTVRSLRRQSGGAPKKLAAGAVLVAVVAALVLALRRSADDDL